MNALQIVALRTALALLERVLASGRFERALIESASRLVLDALKLDAAFKERNCK
jgi:hypothetical protein